MTVEATVTASATSAAPSAAGPVVVPLVVHFMMNPAFPGNDVRKVFSEAEAAECLKDGGEFNAIWASSPAGIVFKLHDLQSCRYSLRDFGYSAEYEQTPSPASDRNLFLGIVDRYNFERRNPGDDRCTGRVGVDRRAVLDVYLFWKLDVFAGYAIPPRIPSERNTRPGAVWIDTDCLNTRGSRDRLFAHEVGHFLGLSHPCRRPGAPDAANPKDRPECGHSDADRVMAPGYSGRSITADEAVRARGRALTLF